MEQEHEELICNLIFFYLNTRNRTRIPSIIRLEVHYFILDVSIEGDTLFQKSNLSIWIPLFKRKSFLDPEKTRKNRIRTKSSFSRAVEGTSKIRLSVYYSFGKELSLNHHTQRKKSFESENIQSQQLSKYRFTPILSFSLRRGRYIVVGHVGELDEVWNYHL